MKDSPYTSLPSVWNTLKDFKHVIISSHIDPDGDSIGSALGLYHILKSQGIHATIINQHPIPKNLEFLPRDIDTYCTPESQDIQDICSSADAWCILDLNAPQRLGPAVRPLFEAFSGFTFVFDHHVEPVIEVDSLSVIIEASSTCEIIARLALTSSLGISNDAAQCLYTGIMTDTGGFRHSRTNADVMRLAATLIDCGADPVMIYDKVMNAQSFSSMTLLGKALSSLQVEHDGALVLMIMRKEDLHGYFSEDLEGFVNYTLSISGAKIGGLITEWADETVKMSLRAKPQYEVRSITEHFGGGGHMQAAGARVKHGNLPEIVQTIINLAGEAINR
ncbi:MAG: DHH family phosphoesterase [Candidatus Kapaibacteriota bacterium]